MGKDRKTSIGDFQLSYLAMTIDVYGCRYCRLSKRMKEGLTDKWRYFG
jgi:hypothetical protein